MSRRWLVGAICGASFAAMGVQAANAGGRNSVTLSAPRTVHVDVDYTMKITGRASERALLSIDINDRCRSTWKKDQHAPYEHDLIRLRKIGRGRIKVRHIDQFPHHSEGTYKFCAYLMSRNGRKTLATAHRPINVV